MEIIKWLDIKDRDYDALILGNGASIAVSPCFSYSSLFKLMQERKEFSDNIEKVFDYLETDDFELVLNRIWHSYHINQALEIHDEKTIAAYIEIRSALIKAIRENHAPFNYVQLFHLSSIYTFLQEFKTVVSLNYDLIVYWAMLYGNRELGNWFKDCFIHGEFCEDWEKFRRPLHASGSTLVFYPHGNLVLARNLSGEEQKLINPNIGEEHTKNLLDHIFQCWENDKTVPLFVSEGDSKQKLKAIRRSSYLSLVYDKVLPQVGRKIAIYGWSLADQDNHIVKQVCNSSLETIAVSVFTGRPTNQIQNEILRMRVTIKQYNPNVEVLFFDSSSVGCWLHN